MRSERIVYSTCSSNARNSFSGGIDGRPVCEYMPANSGDICFQHVVDDLQQPPQRMVLRYPLLGRDIAERCHLTRVFTTHLLTSSILPVGTGLHGSSYMNARSFSAAC